MQSLSRSPHDVGWVNSVSGRMQSTPGPGENNSSQVVLVCTRTSEEVGIDATLLAALCPVATSILKDKQTQLTLASFLPDSDAKLKFIFDEAAFEDLIAVKELLQQGALLNKQETSIATAQRAVDMLVALGVEKENFVVPETEVNYRAKCEWAAMWDLQPAADLDNYIHYNAGWDQDIQPSDLEFDLPMANTNRAGFEEENTMRSGDDLMLGAQDFTEEGVAFSADTRWLGDQGCSSMMLSEILLLQMGGNGGPSTHDFTEEGPTVERGDDTREGAGGGEPGVCEELLTIGNIIEESSSIAMVTSSQDTSFDSVESVSSVIDNASNTSTAINPNSSSQETTPILTTCDGINNNSSNSVLNHKTRQSMGSFSPSLHANDAPPSIGDQGLSRSSVKEVGLKNMATDTSSSDFINSTSAESLVQKASVDVMKQIAASGLTSSNDEEDDVSEVTSSVSSDSGLGSPKGEKRSADSDCDSPKSKRKRVSFSEVDQVQQFVGGNEDASSSWHGLVGDVSTVKAKKASQEVRNKMKEKEVVSVNEVVVEKGVVEEVEERVLAVNTMDEGAVFRGVVEYVIQEEEIVEVGSNKSVEEVDRIPLRSPKVASTVSVLPSVKRDLEVEKGPSCKACVASKKPRLGRYSTDVGMAAHSRKHSRQGWKSGCQVEGCRGKNYRRHMEPRVLVRHARMEHTREELFRCTEGGCKRTFRLRETLVQHEKKHYDPNREYCPKCEHFVKIGKSHKCIS